MPHLRGGFSPFQPAKNSQFHVLPLFFINLCQSLQSLVEGYDIELRCTGNCHGVFKWNPYVGTATFRALPGAGMVDKNPSHQLRCDTEELRTILPMNILLIDQTQIRLMN